MANKIFAFLKNLLLEVCLFAVLLIFSAHALQGVVADELLFQADLLPLPLPTSSNTCRLVPAIGF